MDGLTKEEQQEAIKECFINDLSEEDMKKTHGERFAVSIISLVLGIWICASLGLRVAGLS